MSATEAGFRYPDIVRAGIHLVLDAPAPVDIRVDPDGERKAEERRRSRAAWQEEKRAAGIADEPPVPIRRLPPLKTIHLQWLDTGYGKEVWRDTALHIDLEKRRIHQAESLLLGGGHKGSGAIGVLLFALPVLAAISPYLYVRSRMWSAKERKYGMSRHAIALMGKICGQLDRETEGLLREAFRNDWAHHRKMSRTLTMREACTLLDTCALTVRVAEAVEGDPLRKERLEEYVWHDADRDMVGHVILVDDRLHHCRFLGSTFEEPQARVLIGRFGSRREEAIGED